MTAANYSYALLRIGNAAADSDRRTEWRHTENQQGAVVCDRNTGTGKQARSVWSRDDLDDVWLGSVVWNDNHVSFERSHVLNLTRYGHGVTNPTDSLFAAAGPGDAMMTFSRDDAAAPATLRPKKGSKADYWRPLLTVVIVIAGLAGMFACLWIDREARRTLALARGEDAVQDANDVDE